MTMYQSIPLNQWKEPCQRSHFVVRLCPNVSFNLDKNIEYKSNDITEGETSHLWYNADDFKEFKKSFVILAKEFQAYDRTMPEQRSFKTFLLMAFNAC
eukprot:scaffold6936_cov106-Amphora_coffeaeformis.AAC.1